MYVMNFTHDVNRTHTFGLENNFRRQSMIRTNRDLLGIFYLIVQIQNVDKTLFYLHVTFINKQRKFIWEVIDRTKKLKL